MVLFPEVEFVSVALDSVSFFLGGFGLGFLHRKKEIETFDDQRLGLNIKCSTTQHKTPKMFQPQPLHLRLLTF